LLEKLLTLSPSPELELIGLKEEILTKGPN
jgi:hypothetical protein